MLPLAAVICLASLLKGLVLQLAVWCRWCLHGKVALVVYSNSPLWREHFEKRILPALGERAVVLNLSERGHWKGGLAVAVFRHFGGDREFNPLALVFRPFRWVHEFRFYQPFQELKRGKVEDVAKLERDLLALVQRVP